MSFPSQTTDTTSAPVAVTLTNITTGQVSVTSARSSSLEFSYSGPALPVVLSEGQSLSGFVTFTPAAAREYAAQLTFTFSSGTPGSTGSSSRATIELSATGVKQAASTPPPTPPTITSNPGNQAVTAGQTAAFSVSATGTAPLSYQWKMNGAAISGATSASYTVAATSTANSGETFSVA
ncbi:MAG: immunoglobulin domain-containing protein, partial [Candidatus Acidiferrales bacterium]